MKGPSVTAVLIVEVEIDPADDEEFNRWYDEEHVPEKLRSPGFRSARRFRAHDDDTRYLVIYELDSPEAATSPAYMSQELSAWTRSLMSRWKGWRRSVWVALDSGPETTQPAATAPE
jgi:hypothetical protein